MTLPGLEQNCGISGGPGPHSLHSGSFLMANIALQFTGLLASPHLTPRKDLLMPARLEEPWLGEAQWTGTHPALEMAGHLRHSEQGREHGKEENLIGQTRSLYTAPEQPLPARHPAQRRGPKPPLHERLCTGHLRGSKRTQTVLLPPGHYSMGFTLATNKAVAFFRNSSLLMEVPSFLSCSARSMARARPSGPSLEPASR